MVVDTGHRGGVGGGGDGDGEVRGYLSILKPPKSGEPGELVEEGLAREMSAELGIYLYVCMIKFWVFYAVDGDCRRTALRLFQSSSARFDLKRVL